jgi:UDP-N-acetyl-D-glucosamine/UDP-N-acetyl-D-galactosamine dehydrogenase
MSHHPDGRSAGHRRTWRADLSDASVAVVGLGYVGLPVAVALAEVFPGTVGIDINPEKVAVIRAGRDPIGELGDARVAASGLRATTNVRDAADANIYVVAVPTDVDLDRRPDLQPLVAASEMVGAVLAPGDVVVYESTVWPGLTEEVCGPVLARVSGLEIGCEAFLGYSPERINPGDSEHTLERIVKVVAGQDAATTERVAALYERIVVAGVHRASSIRVAEAAKVIENTQRDLNIALVNELALIFDRLGLPTREVLEAAGTKWNFLPFRPGLVGGHCIGVDPYYLTTKAQQVGYHPEVILAGRRINDGMGAFIAQKTVKLLLEGGVNPARARVNVLGLAFKEGVGDLRNSRVPDIVHELVTFGVRASVSDPRVDSALARAAYGFELVPLEALEPADATVLAVAHPELVAAETLRRSVKGNGVLVDVKSAVAPSEWPGVRYWAL